MIVGNTMCKLHTYVLAYSSDQRRQEKTACSSYTNTKDAHYVFSLNNSS